MRPSLPGALLTAGHPLFPPHPPSLAGKPGVRLTLADLQSQFGVGLKEAAARLGICPTTLQRACRWAVGCRAAEGGLLIAALACTGGAGSRPAVPALHCRPLLPRRLPTVICRSPRRRHGIQRWPRRQLQKVNRALDELEARQMLQPHQHLLGTGAATAAAAGGGFAPGAGPGGR